jgi:hypothetical protein
VLELSVILGKFNSGGGGAKDTVSFLTGNSDDGDGKAIATGPKTGRFSTFLLFLVV